MSDCHYTPSRNMDFMGYSMRVDEWRYVEWLRWDGEALRPVWEEVVARELYDHSAESHDAIIEYIDESENENVAEDPGNAALVRELSDKLRSEVERWLPPGAA